MTELALFMAHCAATFALAGCQGFRLACMGRLAGVSEECRGVVLRIFQGAGNPWILAVMVVELGTGVALLGFENWRESAFSASMLVLAAIWLLTLAAILPTLAQKFGISREDAKARRGHLSLRLRAFARDIFMPHGSFSLEMRRLMILEGIRMAAWVARGAILVLIALV